jgi:N-acetylmuramoyl-L-alanine amidase
VEAGFLSHDEEEAFLASNSGQRDIAGGIFSAFEEYKDNYETSSISEVKDNAIEPTPDFFVQLAASARELDLTEQPWKMYDNIQVRQENDYYKYLVGPFETIDDAKLIKTKLTGDGFEQAFVVAYQGDTRISLQKLRAEGR